MTSLCIISYNCMGIYSYLKRESLIKKEIGEINVNNLLNLIYLKYYHFDM